MVLKKAACKYENCIGTALLLLAVGIFASVRYDFYFDLNDDVLMKDILAGVYTGVPEGHNIQMLWPVSAFISLFYRIAGSLPWYGIFLCLCHFGSLGLMVCRSLSFCERRRSKALLLLAEGLLIIGLLLKHLVFVQYTVTCTLLAAAAAFLFFTTDRTLPAGEFIRKNIGTVLLVGTAYLIRSEMLLLVLPMICAAGVSKWGGEKKIFTKENTLKYLAVIGGILGLMGLGQAAHEIAYGSGEWKAFTEYFNNRTELYDFQVLPEYAPHQAFYESIGMTESERELLANYNFGLDEEIDEVLVGEVASYAASVRGREQPFLEKLKESMGNYFRRTVYPPSHNESDYPWNYLILFSYLAVFVTALLQKEGRLWQKAAGSLWQLGLLGAVRSGLWLFIIMRDRVPVRISHSLYFMEFAILAGMLFVNLKEGEGRRKGGIALAAGICYGLLGAAILPFSIEAADLDAAQKAENNRPYEQLYDYLGAEENQQNFYFIDVYSSVNYTEKLFVNVDNSLDNYDIMGGWACKSPLQRKKLKVFGISSMEEALVTMENVYYVQEKGAELDWLYRYYADHGRQLKTELTKAIGESFEIYRLSAD